jgi:hypothetical protein
MKLIVLYHVFVHPICHIPLFNFHKKNKKYLESYTKIWEWTFMDYFVAILKAQDPIGNHIGSWSLGMC